MEKGAGKREWEEAAGSRYFSFFLCLLLKHLNPCPLNRRHLMMLFGIIFISTVLIPFKL